MKHAEKRPDRSSPVVGAPAAAPPGRRRGRGPSLRKRQAILGAARELFFQHGYEGTSMDDVAARAGVSKQTVYSHFVDKSRLFSALVTADIAGSETSAHPLIEAMPNSEDVERDLRTFARAHLEDVMQPDLLRMRRMLIGEAERFPELAKAWYDAGPVRSCAVFASWFEALDERGLLRVPDPMLAAQHFNWLVLSIPVNAAMSVPDAAPLYTKRELQYFADEGVRVFLAAYGPDAGS
ncbi:TetR/AcrR family transcriptional regulator [Nocardioides sp.]|uniref:TetR/AcrR family transcriptional regulator n=1 Tax=Nocardioides sp. TaxID=35761 RepID=UPI002ED4C37A